MRIKKKRVKWVCLREREREQTGVNLRLFQTWKSKVWFVVAELMELALNHYVWTTKLTVKHAPWRAAKPLPMSNKIKKSNIWSSSGNPNLDCSQWESRTSGEITVRFWWGSQIIKEKMQQRPHHDSRQLLFHYKRLFIGLSSLFHSISDAHAF